MTFDEFAAEIGLLLTRMQNEPQDRHEIYQTLKERLNEMRAYGMPLPQDLLDLERSLEEEFSSDGTDSGEEAS
jgi:predicted unusual protein kinase regulating ubiquinone biosynthesis (AarF/ABC1/UbiB family)